MRKNVVFVLGGAVALVVASHTAVVRAVTCGPKPPIPPGSCIRDYRCSSEGSWEDLYYAAGTACNDGNACTFGDVCVNSTGTCRGTAVTCARPCEYCNGTAACALRASGTTCPTPVYLASDRSPDPCEAICDGVSPYCQPR